MPTISDNNYNKLLDTNLYTIQNVYKNNPNLLFLDTTVNNYPEKKVLVVNLLYDYYQLYVYNQFKNILPGLTNNKSIKFINNYIPWYLNKNYFLIIEYLEIYHKILIIHYHRL